MNIKPSIFFASWWNYMLTLLAIVAVAAGITGGTSKPAVQPAIPPFVTTAANRLAMKIPDSLPAGSVDAETVVATPMSHSEASDETSSLALASTTTAQTSTGMKPGSDTSMAPGVGRPTVPSETRPKPPALPVVSDPAEGSRFRLPLVFQPVNPQALTPAIQDKLTQLQDQFVKEVGGDGPDPTDRAYQERWLTAQEIADERFRAQFGYAAYEELEAQQVQNASQ
ncbi:MAG TPA: hypothetical protein VMV72_00570 [Verrucomicrobiae bacterium]|nr:hypothetical protein [Verrucomicrobiae bacterium]